MKYGLWENGKRIKWFTSNQVESINEQLLDYSDFFELTKSKKELPKDLGFEPPENFEELVDEILKDFPEMK